MQAAHHFLILYNVQGLLKHWYPVGVFDFWQPCCAPCTYVTSVPLQGPLTSAIADAPCWDTLGTCANAASDQSPITVFCVGAARLVMLCTVPPRQYST